MPLTRRQLVRSSLSLLGSALVFGLASCANNDQDKIVINEGLSSLLAIYKHPSLATIDKEFANYTGPASETLKKVDGWFIELKARDVDPDKMIEHLFMNYSYEIDSIEISGDSASSKATITSNDLPEAIVAYKNYMGAQEAKDQLQALVNSSKSYQHDAYLWYFDKMFSFIEEAKTDTESLAFSFSRAKEGWEVSEKSLADFLGILADRLDLVVSAVSASMR